MKTLKKALLSEDKFENVSFSRPPSFEWSCVSCAHKNSAVIMLNDPGDGMIDQLVDGGCIDSDILLNQCGISITSKRFVKVGQYSYRDLPTVYSYVFCADCEARHVMIYGEGELNLFRYVCHITGIWLWNSMVNSSVP